MPYLTVFRHLIAVYNTFKHLQVVVLTTNAEISTPIFNRKNFYTQSHFYGLGSKYKSSPKAVRLLFHKLLYDWHSLSAKLRHRKFVPFAASLDNVPNILVINSLKIQRYGVF